MSGEVDFFSPLRQDGNPQVCAIGLNYTAAAVPSARTSRQLSAALQAELRGSAHSSVQEQLQQ